MEWTLDSRLGEQGYHIGSNPGSPYSHYVGAGWEEHDASEQDDHQFRVRKALRHCFLRTARRHSPPRFSSDDSPSPFPVDEDECLDGEVAAAEKLAKEMLAAAVPEAPRIYVPPESFCVKRLVLLQTNLFFNNFRSYRSEHCFMCVIFVS
jgi:hypothetical protein